MVDLECGFNGMWKPSMKDLATARLGWPEENGYPEFGDVCERIIADVGWIEKPATAGLSREDVKRNADVAGPTWLFQYL